MPEDWQRRMTVTVDEYAAIIGIGRNTAYEAVRAGEVQVIRQRGRILVCVPPLLRQLGIGERPVEAVPPQIERFRRLRRVGRGQRAREA